MATGTIQPVVSTVPMAGSGADTRLLFIDNLRWTMIMLVVSMHAAVTYSHLGSWYFMEDPKPGTLVMAIFATYQIFLQAFFMGLLFLIAGYFVPNAFDRRGALGFVRDRAIRLGLPSLFFMLVVQPFTIYWLLRTFVHPTRPSLTQAYLLYLVSGRFLSGSGPMWFAVALLVFSVVYAVIRNFGSKTPRNDAAAALPTNPQVMGLILLIGACTFLMRIVQPIGANILNMQLCFFSQYILLFCVGIYTRRRNWLLRLPYSFGRRWLTLALSLGTVAWVALLAALLKTHSEDKLGGGITWQSAAFSFWEAFFCVGTCLGLIVIFREKFNYQGRVQQWFSANAFAVYLFHTPVLIAVTLMMRGIEAPKLVKFLMATVLGITFTFAGSSLVFRRIPLLKRVL